jgi:hypothetical protein
MSQTQRDFTQLRGRQRISFSAWNQPTLQHLLILGHDWERGAHNPENADVVGPSGMAMIAVVTNCCEISA